MKYKIIVERTRDNRYLAYCPQIYHMRADGDNLDAALAGLRQGLLCFLHDPEPELEITVDKPGENTDMLMQLMRMPRHRGN